MRDITKTFPGVIANDDANLSVKHGEIHAVIGENGAGKSTLMKILYGMQPADEGTIRIDGEAVNFKSPRDAIADGVGLSTSGGFIDDIAAELDAMAAAIAAGDLVVPDGSEG